MPRRLHLLCRLCPLSGGKKPDFFTPTARLLRQRLSTPRGSLAEPMPLLLRRGAARDGAHSPLEHPPTVSLPGKAPVASTAGRDGHRAAAERPRQGRILPVPGRNSCHPAPRAPARCRASPAGSRHRFTGLGFRTAGVGEQPGASSLVPLRNGLRVGGGHVVRVPKRGSFPAPPALTRRFWPPCKTKETPNLSPKAKKNGRSVALACERWTGGREDSVSQRRCLRADGARALLWEISDFHNAGESRNVARG